jgi:hypothetical protein
MKIRYILFLISFFFSLSSQVIDRAVNFSEWRDFCFENLEEFDHVLDTKASLRVLMRAYGIKQTVAPGEFCRALKEAQDKIADQMTIPAAWLEGETLAAPVPFIQQLIVNPKSRVYIQGDIHGSVHSLLRNLERARAGGYLNEDFKLAENVYMVFLGDYGDRGRYSAEVFYTLFRLKAANPDAVILLRGNHEEEAMARVYGLTHELAIKYGLEGGKFLLRGLAGFFDHLPSLCWVGERSEEGVSYIGGCHGLPTLGFDMVSFFKKPECRFARLTFDSALKDRQLSLFDDIDQESLRKAYEKKDQIPGTCCSEFSWGDMNCQVEYKERRGNALSFPERIVRKLLNSFSSPSDRILVKSFFRGHQHVQGSGCFDSYITTDSGIALKRLHEELVHPIVAVSIFTLISAPEGVGFFKSADKDSFCLFDFDTKHLCMLDYPVPEARVGRSASGNRFIGSLVRMTSAGSYQWDRVSALQKRLIGLTGEKRVFRDADGGEEESPSCKRDKKAKKEEVS